MAYIVEITSTVSKSSGYPTVSTHKVQMIRPIKISYFILGFILYMLPTALYGLVDSEDRDLTMGIIFSILTGVIPIVSGHLSTHFNLNLTPVIISRLIIVISWLVTVLGTYYIKRYFGSPSMPPFMQVNMLYIVILYLTTIILSYIVVVRIINKNVC